MMRGVFAVSLVLGSCALSCTRTQPAVVPERRAVEAAAPAPVPVVAPATIPELLEQRIQAGSITYVFRSSRLANLLYQLDCVAGTIRCSRPAYRELWTSVLGGLDDADRAALDAWAALRNRYGGQIEHGSEPNLADPELPVPRGTRQIQTAIRILGLTASSTAEYGAVLESLLEVRDAEEARTIVARFEPRFTPWWRTRTADLSRAIASYAELAAREDVGRTTQGIERFYGPELPSPAEQIFDLVARPVHDTPTYGNMVGSHGVVEVVEGEAARERFPIVMHELFHVWFSAAPRRSLIELAQRFATSTDADAIAAYGLLDEVIATDFGNVLIARLLTPESVAKDLATPRGLYNEPFVDSVAKVALPLLEARVTASKGPFSDDFVHEYLGAVHAAFPHGMPPIGRLKPLLCLYDASLSGAYDRLTAASGSNTIASDTAFAKAGEMLSQFKRWPLVVLVTTSHLRALDGLGPELPPSLRTRIANEARQHSRFALAARRPSGSDLFVLVAPDDASLTLLVDEFAKLEQLSAGFALQAR